jgi:hypothetical protein
LNSVLVGYFPQKSKSEPTSPAAGVDEICCVPGCLTNEIEGWVNHWKHNDMFLFNDESTAWGLVQDSEKKHFDLYAYKMIPLAIRPGDTEPAVIPNLPVAPLNTDFENLGYDIQSRSDRSEYRCSPLLCNVKLGLCKANRHCLLDDRDQAIELAQKFERRGCEPGPYFVMEVWRRKRPAK